LIAVSAANVENKVERYNKPKEKELIWPRPALEVGSVTETHEVEMQPSNGNAVASRNSSQTNSVGKDTKKESDAQETEQENSLSDVRDRVNAASKRYWAKRKEVEKQIGFTEEEKTLLNTLADVMRKENGISIVADTKAGQKRLDELRQQDKARQTDASRKQMEGMFEESDFEHNADGTIKTDAEGRTIVKQGVLEEIQQEQKEIYDKAKADGRIKTDEQGNEYAVAPNGERSNLSVQNWLQTRTARFKKWFGDWEAAAEIANMQKRVADWLNPANLQAAQGLTREQIIQKFGNELEGVAFVPEQYMQLLDPTISDNRIYSGKGYMIDHAVNHHPNVPASDYSNIQHVLNAPDAIKDVTGGSGTGKSIAFIKNIGRHHAVIIELSTDENGKIILHKSYFNQKKMPYVGKPDIRQNPPMGATPSYIHANQTYGSKLPALGGTAKVNNYLIPPKDFSKIVDENGEPLVVWRGTPEDLGNTFKYGQNVYGGHKGFWFTPAKSVAEDYSFDNVSGKSGDVKGAFLKADKVMDFLPLGARCTSKQFCEYVKEKFGIDLGNGSKKEFFVSELYEKYEKELYPSSYNAVRFYDGSNRAHSYIVKTPNQIKSATGNVGTFSEKTDDIRFYIGKKKRGEYEARLKKAGYSNEDIATQLDFLHGLEQNKEQDKVVKVAVDWLAKKGIQDVTDKLTDIEKAIKVAELVGTDITQYSSPQAVFDAYPEKVEQIDERQRINPDDVPQLTNRTEMEHGVVVYDVEDSPAGRQAMREILNTHFGKDANPWCLLQGDGKGNLTAQSADYWNHYNAYPKQVAFKDGKLLAFSANDSKRVQWWDRTDAPHDSVYHAGTEKTVEQREDGTRVERETTLDGEFTFKEREYAADGTSHETVLEKDPEADFLVVAYEREYDADGRLVKQTEYGSEYGRDLGDRTETEYHPNGKVKAERMYDAEERLTNETLFNEDGKKVYDVEYYDNGQKRDEYDAETDIFQEWYYDGSQRCLKKDGLTTYWTEGGIKFSESFEDEAGNKVYSKLWNTATGLLIEETLWENNSRITVKYNSGTGQMVSKETEDEQHNLKYVEYYENGNKQFEITYYPDHRRVKTRDAWYENGQLKSTETYDEKRNLTKCVEYDEQGNVVRNERYFRADDGEIYGFADYASETIYIDPKYATAETLVHEFDHPWCAVLRMKEPKAWRSLVDAVNSELKGTPLWNEVVERYPELKGDELAEEVFCFYGGRDGEARLKEAMKEAAETPGIMEKAAAVDAITRLRKILSDFWKSVMRLFRINPSKMKVEDFSKRSLHDLLSGMNPFEGIREARRKDVSYAFSETPEDFDATRERAKAEKGTVMPGLAEKEFDVVEVDRHPFEGSGQEAKEQARAWAEEHLSGRECQTKDGSKCVISSNSVGEFMNDARINDSESIGSHISVLMELPKVIAGCEECEIHPDVRKVKKKRLWENGFNDNVLMHVYYGCVQIGDYTYRVRVSMKEYRETDKQNRVYAFSTKEIEKIELLGEPCDAALKRQPSAYGETMTHRSISGAKLLQGVEKSYEKGKKLLDESKKSSSEEDNLFRDGDNVFGNNSGYVGYSKSRRAVGAENKGLRNKSQMDQSFSDEVNQLIEDKGGKRVSLKKIKEELENIPSNEWHHTGMYGKKTDYYSAETVANYFLNGGKPKVQEQTKEVAPTVEPLNTDIEKEFDEQGRLRKIVTTSADGMVETAEYSEDGKLQRETTTWTNGAREEKTYSENATSKTLKRWNGNGQQTYDCSFYENGKKKHAVSWNEDGKKASEVSYYDNGRVKVDTSWNENGWKQSEVRFNIRGKEEVATSWYENGQKAEEILYDNNGNTQSYHRWDEQGNVMEDDAFRDGRRRNNGRYLNRKGDKKIIDEHRARKNNLRSGTVVSVDDAAKIRQNLESLAKDYEKSANKTVGLLTNVALEMGAIKEQASDYVTIELPNGDHITLRTSNHNADVQNFDERGEKNAISIVITRQRNSGLKGVGNADVIEFYYNKKELENMDGNKPVLIKRGIFAKNALTHPFSAKESKRILQSALYSPTHYGQSQPISKPHYWVAIKANAEEKSPMVVLEVNNTKENLEVVGWYTLDERNMERIKRQAMREGGELFMLQPDGSKVGSLSTPTQSLSDRNLTGESLFKKPTSHTPEASPDLTAISVANVENKIERNNKSEEKQIWFPLVTKNSNCFLRF